MSMTFQAEGVAFNFLGTGKPLRQYSTDCLLFWAWNDAPSFHPHWQCYTRTHCLHIHIATTVSKCPSASVSVPQWAFGKSITHTTFSIWDQQLSLALAHMKWQCCLLLPPDKGDDSLWSFTQCNFDGPHRLLFMVLRYGACHSSWHVQGLHHIHIHLNTEWYWCVHNCPIKNLLLPMNVNQWNILHSQKLNHCMLFILHWDQSLTMQHFHGCNSEISGRRTIKLHTKIMKSLMSNWDLLHNAMWVCLSEKKWKNYFSVCPSTYCHNDNFYYFVNCYYSELY
jgi:hypothetical protein